MKLKIYNYGKEFHIEPHCLYPMGNEAWISVDDWNVFLQDYPQYRDCTKELFVKIECHEDLSDFTIFKKLCKSQSAEFSGYVRLPKDIKPITDLTTNKKTEVALSVVDSLHIPVAEIVKIKVKEDDVDTWNKSDIEEATKKLKEISLYCQGQKLFVNRSRTDFAVGEFMQVEPKPATKNSPFWINQNTEIIFEGMPISDDCTINFDMIGGQKKVVDELRRIIQLPMNFPEYFAKFDTKPPKGILLYGPPGNGKTMIARAVAQSLGASFIEIDLTDALQKYKGVGEHNLGKKFEEAEHKKNAVIFIDEIDSIASIRSRDSENHEVTLVGKLLSLMDGIKTKHRVVVIGATNRLYAIDPALRRPGRFDKELEVPMPDYEGRLDILRKYVKLDQPDLFDSSVTIEYLSKLAKDIEGYSGADIAALYSETVMSAIRKHLRIEDNGKASMMKEIEDVVISMDDFESAKDIIRSTQQRNSLEEGQKSL